MKWTSEKPTEPGWYWFRYSGHAKHPINIKESDLPVKGGHPDWEWAGPIPEPTDAE